MGFALEFPRFWHEAFTLNKHLNQMVHGERPMTPNTLRDTVHGFQAIEGQAHHLARHLGAPKEGVTLDEALTRVFQAVGGKKAQIVAPASDAPLVGNRTMETMERQALRAGIQFRHVPLPRAFDELTDAVRLNANLPQALPTLQRLEQALKA